MNPALKEYSLIERLKLSAKASLEEAKSMIDKKLYSAERQYWDGRKEMAEEQLKLIDELLS